MVKKIIYNYQFYYISSLAQVKKVLKRQRQSSKLTPEQIQRKLTENGFFKDDLSKNAPVNIFIQTYYSSKSLLL